jgi:hypothetical protein
MRPLKDAGLVEIKGHRIYITDVPALNSALEAGA